MAMIAVDYDEFDPDTYRGIEVYDNGKEVVASFESGDFIEDLDDALFYARQNFDFLSVSSSFGNFFMDAGDSHPKYSVGSLYGARLRLKWLHDVQGLSWRKIARRGEYSGVSHSTLRDISSGAEPSTETCRLLDIRKTDRHRLHYEAGRGEEGEQKREEIKREMESLGFSSFTDYVDWLRDIAHRDFCGDD